MKRQPVQILKTLVSQGKERKHVVPSVSRADELHPHHRPTSTDSSPTYCDFAAPSVEQSIPENLLPHELCDEPVVAKQLHDHNYAIPDPHVPIRVDAEPPQATQILHDHGYAHSYRNHSSCCRDKEIELRKLRSKVARLKRAVKVAKRAKRFNYFSVSNIVLKSDKNIRLYTDYVLVLQQYANFRLFSCICNQE